MGHAIVWQVLEKQQIMTADLSNVYKKFVREGILHSCQRRQSFEFASDLE